MALQFAPATRIRIAQLNEIYRSLVFVPPSTRYQLVLRRIDPQKRSGPDHRVHREVIESQPAVKYVWRVIAVPGGMRDQTCFSMLITIELGVCFVNYQPREIWIGNRLILLPLVHVYAVEPKQIFNTHSVDHAEAEELLDVWFR